MKRTNPKKGLDVDPKWVEITWEEALDTVAKKLKEIRANDPRELVIMTGFGMSELTMNGLMMEFRFPLAYGTPNVSTTKGQFCAIHYGVCLTQNNMPTCTEDAGLCNYLILLGRSGGINASYANGDARSFVRNVERGMKVVCVDPMCSTEGSFTEWVPIVPGTDLAFVLALTHVVLYELDRYDKDFVRDRTNAPYLVGDDKYYVRGPNGKPMIWDLSDNKAKEWDDKKLKKAKAALTGEYTYNGQAVRPAFVPFKENYRQYTPNGPKK